MKALEIYEPGLLAELAELASPPMQPTLVDLDALIEATRPEDAEFRAQQHEVYLQRVRKVLMRIKEIAERPPGSTGRPRKVDRDFANMMADAIELARIQSEANRAQLDMITSALSIRMSQLRIGGTPKPAVDYPALAKSRERAAKKAARVPTVATPERRVTSAMDSPSRPSQF